jgi:hypothetical protein
MTVFCCILEEGEEGYQSALEESLDFSRIYKDFRILERSPVSIIGEQGEKVVYSYLWEPPLRPEGSMGDEPKPTETRMVLFVHKNILWKLEIESSPSNAETTKADFEHIKQTFKILN